MRSMMTIGLLVLSLTVVGCDRSEMPAPGNALAAPGPADGPRGAGTAPVATASRADAAASAPAPAPPPAAPVWREVTIPAGTSLPIVLDTSVGSETSRVEEPVTAHLSRAVTVGGQTAVPDGSRVSGVVTAAIRSAKVKGRAHVAMRFNSLTPRGDDQRYAIATATVGRTAPATKKEDALKIGAPAAGGAIVGAIFGGKKGAAIGTAAGGGAGTAVVLGTRGKEVSLPRGAALTLKLTAPLTMRIRA